MRALKQDISVTDYEHLTGIYHVMKTHGDDINAEKIVDLYKKKQADEFTISFTGHFSAGKSSMINALIGSEILPKSPIPTSANIVKLTSGEGVARVYFKQDHPVEYKEPYDIDMIKEYAKNKDTITKIEISTRERIIPEHASIIDTPGIDAADDTDRIITESSLHLVDVLFYVMDYNHVQSEINLMFLKKIQSMKIPFYIIINQIDKHNEKELSFHMFETSVEQTLEQWGLSPEKIYYSSLLQEDAPFNQFHEIKEKITDLFNERLLRIDASVQYIVDAHKQFLTEKYEEAINELAMDGEVDGSLLEKIKAIQAALASIEKRLDDFQEDYMHALDQTLKNAYLMPATVRELALHFLESQQKDFKIGFIGAKKKTEEEKAKRLTAFLTRVKESKDTSIEWKLREKFTDLLKEYTIKSQDIFSTVQHFSVPLTEGDILSVIKKGAQINGDSVLNYTNDLANAIKAKYRTASRTMLSEIERVMKQEADLEQKELAKDLKTFEEQMKVQEEYRELEKTYYRQMSRIDEQFHHPEFSNETEEIIRQKIANIVFVQGETYLEAFQQQERVLQVETEEVREERDSLPAIDRVINAIDQTIHTLEDLSAFQSLLAELTERKDRLANRQLTIALFGAFSAGKSSLANALIGESVLPSSPNPTTAVINRITPVTDVHPHGTVVIQLKDEATLVQDLRTILKHFSPPIELNFGSLVEWIVDKEIQSSEELSQMYQSYLQAIIRGYQEQKEFIGKTRMIQLEEFRAYVTDEAKACYVEAIDLYYDCSITQKGITLVDTPGADSINARHTNVAFDYIKNADAILYVTYYNHAITKADKDFVMQLGRVKDSFQLDKMFFLINASDLAKDETELNLVINYVQDQLLQFGIRNPRLYPVSSKRSLEEKLANEPINQEMHQFEEEFYSFLENELSQIALQTAIHELRRTEQMFIQFKKKASLDDQEKQLYKEKLLTRKENLQEELQTQDKDVHLNRIKQKISKQLHYVGERIGIRFHDMFKDKFNPTTITESGRKANQQLEKNMLDLLDYCGYELLQEARAVSLRIEAYMKEQFTEFRENVNQNLRGIDKDFTMPSVNGLTYTTPEYQQPLQELDLSMFKKAFSLFKGTKSFFEKNEKEKMKEVLYQLLQPEIHQYLQHIEDLMQEHYRLEWEQVIAQDLHDVAEEINQYVKNSLQALEQSIDMNLLIKKENELNTILKNMQ